MRFGYAIALLCLAVIIIKLSLELTLYRGGSVSKKNVDSIFLAFSALLVILFYGLRGDTGQDYMAYWRIFCDVYRGGLVDLIDNYSISSEFLYYFLMLFCGKIAFGNLVYGYALFNFIVGILMVSLVFPIIRRFSPDVSFSVLLFLLHFGFAASFNATRSCLAYYIVFYALTFVYDGKPLNWILWLIIAIHIHFSTVILLPLYFVRFLPVLRSVKIQIVYYASLLLAVLIFPLLIYFVVFQWGFYNEYIGYYAFSGIPFSIGQLIDIFLILFCIFVFLFDRTVLLNKNENIWVMSFMGYLTFFILRYKMYLLERYYTFFGLGMIVFLPKITGSHLFGKYRYVVVFFIILCFLSVALVTDSFSKNYELFTTTFSV